MKTILAKLLTLAYAAPLCIVEGDAGGIVPIENLMDASLDDLKDIPGFTVPPIGHYKLLVSLEKKVVNDHQSVEAKCEVVDTFELANKNESKVENGTKFSQLFMMDNEWGQGGFKGFVLPIAQALGIKTVGEAIDKIQNIQIAATLKHRYHKEDKALPVAERRTFANLGNIEVL